MKLTFLDKGWETLGVGERLMKHRDRWLLGRSGPGLQSSILQMQGVQNRPLRKLC